MARKSRRRMKRRKSRKSRRRRRGGACEKGAAKVYDESQEDFVCPENIKHTNDKKYKKEIQGGRKSRKRRGGSTNPAVMALVNIFYKPPPKVAPGKLKSGLGASNWESQWTTLVNQLRCYLGNMEKHKMDRKNYIKNGKGFMMNKKKRKVSWDKCKHNKKGDILKFAIDHFMRHGFVDPAYVNLKPEDVSKAIMSKLPTKDALMAKLATEKFWHDVGQKRHAEAAVAKTKFGGKSRRRKRSRKRKRTRRRR